MELIKLTDRIWYSMYEEERDRPCLGYVRGDRYSLAVDAGHSEQHVREFYECLRREDLPLPALTVITHWHWDHAFGMHAVSGRTIANARTNRYLEEFAARVAAEGKGFFLAMDPSIRKEYENDRPVVIVPADLIFHEKLSLDLGGVHARLSVCVSPHTDDTTLVEIPEAKTLFLGDCISGVFPTWERDPGKTRELIGALRQKDAGLFVGGHWPVCEKQELLEKLEESLEEIGQV